MSKRKPVMRNFEKIATMTQGELKEAIEKELTRIGYKPFVAEGFIYAEGTLPVMLVAHMDTAHETPAKTICRSRGGNIIMSPEGIGGDDRAGVFMAMRLNNWYGCHVLFCEDEELGGAGAYKFIESRITPDINYIVGLDRSGSNDAVFYGCNNPEFIEFVKGFGFEEDIGSFSDISIIAPELGVAAVNISAGFYNEHTRHEYVDMNVVHRNIARVGEMITTETDRFEYIDGFAEDSLLVDGSFVCEPDDAITTIEWCEENCHRYHRCDTVARAIDDLKIREGEE